VTVGPNDLRGAARDSYDMWRSLGLSESAAMNALIEDGLVELSDHDRLVRNFRSTFGLSEAQAERAARGRGGSPTSTPVSGQSSVEEGDQPWPESGLSWHVRFQREMARLDRERQEIKALQEERWRREDEEKINRERKKLGLSPVDLDRYR
jgi:hypothetical protein